VAGHIFMIVVHCYC